MCKREYPACSSSQGTIEGIRACRETQTPGKNRLTGTQPQYKVMWGHTRAGSTRQRPATGGPGTKPQTKSDATINAYLVRNTQFDATRSPANQSRWLRNCCVRRVLLAQLQLSPKKTPVQTTDSVVRSTPAVRTTIAILGPVYHWCVHNAPASKTAVRMARKAGHSRPVTLLGVDVLEARLGFKIIFLTRILKVDVVICARTTHARSTHVRSRASCHARSHTTLKICFMYTKRHNAPYCQDYTYAIVTAGKIEN